jgi:Zn-dependent protease with chaperone function
MVFAITFPVQLVGIGRCLFGERCDVVTWVFSVLELVAVGLIAIGLAIAVDQLRTYQSAKPEALSAGLLTRVVKAVEVARVSIDERTLRKIRVLTNDLSMGAHVHGVLRPHVVISGGMLVGILRQDSRALAILAHEIAHLQHFDQFLPGIIGLSGFEIVGRIYKFVGQDLGEGLDGGAFAAFSLVALGMMGMMIVAISRISIYREFYADAKGIALTGDIAAYTEVLRQISGRESKSSGFFHPSPDTRLKQLQEGYPLLRKATFWKLYWSAVFLTSWFQWWMARLLDSENGGGHTAQYAGGGALIALACLCFEFTRRFWAPKRSR